MGDEFSRIARYFAPLAGPEGLGLQDDAAIFTPPSGRELVLTVDQMLEGIHFLTGDAPDLIARKLLRRNLSDLAAMGAVPSGYLLTTALPPGIDEAWLEAFANGLAQDQAEFGINLFGGDSSSSQQHISLTVTMIGHIAPGSALRRNGAKPGDEIWVTGTIGDAALGLRARRDEFCDPSGFLTRRSLLPSPRIGLRLANIATAAIDISDGLLQDLAHICTASGVSAVIHSDLVPKSPAVAALDNDMLEALLTEGDDYELLLAVPAENSAQLVIACGNMSISKIGHFFAGDSRVKILGPDFHELKFANPGWRHF
jgi:thiamine-monophosphate kinase